MQLQIISPTKTLFSGEIHLVKVPGTKGSFEVLNNHAAIISTLETGKIKVITQKGEESFFDSTGGFIEVKNNKVSVLLN